MNISSTLKIAAIFCLGATGTSARAPHQSDTLRVAHVRYTPDGDYINMERIKNGVPSEKYTEIISAPDDELTMFGDTIVIQRTHRHSPQEIINISRNHQIHQQQR